jgi:CubicO group peptidase (beta-lactamase class C family)
MKLGVYMQRHVFEPVSVTDATFHMEERPDLQARRAKYWRRVGETLEETRQVMPDPIKGDLGGGGLYSTVGGMLKVYHGILTGKLLQQTTVEQMFRPQLETTVGLENPSQWSLPYRNAVYNAVPNDNPVNFGLGGLLNLTPIPGRRGPYSLTWSGKPNLYWVSSKPALFEALSLICVALSGSI